MIVSHKHKFIFIRTRKTASTSVQIACSRCCGDTDIITCIDQDTPEDLQRMEFRGPQNDQLPITQWSFEDWRRCFKMRKWQTHIHPHTTAAQVRSLVGNTVWNSYFKFSIERNPFDRAISFYYWIMRHASTSRSFEDRLLNIRPRKLSNWPIYTIDDQIAVDYMLRYESLESDMREVEKAIGLPPLSLPLPRAKSNFRKNHQHYSELITPALRVRIEQVCAKEMAAFDYHWEEAA